MGAGGIISDKELGECSVVGLTLYTFVFIEVISLYWWLTFGWG